MSKEKFITYEGLRKFKELLDDSYSAKFEIKKQSTVSGSSNDNALEIASDEETKTMLDGIFGN